MSAAPEGFDEGSVEISYFGDPEMTQAWVVLSGPTGSVEHALSKVSPSSSREWTSLWDLSTLGTASVSRPLFAFHNAGSTPVVVTMQWWSSEDGPRELRRGIGPGQTALSGPPGRHAGFASGRLVARHSGEAGQVSMAGFLVKNETIVASLPTADPADLESGEPLELLVLPAVADTRLFVTILDARQAGDPQEVRIVLIDRRSGAPVIAAPLSFRPGESRTVDLLSLDPSSGLANPEDLRVSISSDEAGIVAFGLAVLPDGGVVDLAFISRSKVHDSGTYPILSLQTHEVSTTFVNLGEEAAQVFSHFSSDLGEYALEPIDIPAGASHRLDFRALASQELQDRLGRRLEPDFQQGFFQWFSRRGSTELLARTEARRLGESDWIGFNCFGCCEEMPSGAVIPQSVAFDVGQSISFETAEFVDTCAGRTGPFYAFPDSLSYSAPLNWTSQVISTGDFANQIVSFQGSGEYTWVTCATKTRFFFGAGSATSDKCLKDHHPEFDPKRSCASQTGNCSTCYACCDKEKEVGLCRCAKLGSPASCTQGVRVACGRCKEVCLGSHIETCNQQVVDCP